MAEKILVVDDEREIADLVALYLKNEGYETLVCYNGQEGPGADPGRTGWIWPF